MMGRKMLWNKGNIKNWSSAFLFLIIACLMTIYFLSVRESNLFFEWKNKDFHNPMITKAFRTESELLKEETKVIKDDSKILNKKESELFKNESQVLKKNESELLNTNESELFKNESQVLKKNESGVLNTNESELFKNKSQVLKKNESELLNTNESELIKNESQVLKKNESELLNKNESELLKNESQVLKKNESELLNKNESKTLNKDGSKTLNKNELVVFRDESEVLNTNETNLLNKTEFTAFKDDLFAPMLSLFLRKARGELQPKMKSFRSGSVPRVLLWSRPFNNRFWKSQITHIRDGLCPLPCDVIFDEQKKNTVDAVIIYLRGAKNAQTVTESLAPRDLRQPWIMLTFEAPPLANSEYKTKFKIFNGFFNRTMMYRHDADIRVSHGFIVRRGEDAESLPRSWVVPPVMDVGNQSRKLAVSFMSNCKSKTNRLLYIHNVQHYAPVDIYGACGKLKCGHSMYVAHKYNSTNDKCLKIAGENYLFFLAFENSFCKDYLTEKAYNLLYYPIVPVVRGSADYATLFPPNSYIDATKYSPKELAEKLLFLQKHPQEYQKYLAWRHYYQPSTIGGERTLCHLCARLYDPDFYQHQVIEDFVDWFVSKSHCMAEMIL